MTDAFPIDSLDALDVVGKIVVVTVPDGHAPTPDLANEFNEAVHNAGGVCLLFMTHGWKVEALDPDDLAKILQTRR